VIVVDTNVIAYLLMPGVHSRAARNAYQKEPEWAAPLLWRSEFRNVLLTTTRQRGLLRSVALGMMEAARTLMAGREFEIDSSAVLELGSRSICSAYDCEFVALAQELHVKLLTEDRQILRAFPETTVRLRTFVHKPAV